MMRIEKRRNSFSIPKDNHRTSTTQVSHRAAAQKSNGVITSKPS